MKSTTRSTPLTARSFSPRAAALMTLATATVVHGATATWNGTTDNAWATATNWSATPVPGAGDLAIFANAGGADDTIDLGAGVTLRNLLFDSATAAAYTIGTGAAGSQTLTLEGTGAVTMNATVAVNELINANLNLGTAAGAQGFTITNNKAAASNTLTVAGGISTTQTGLKTLTTAGTGIVNLSGAITDGSGSIALSKTAAHVLTLSGNSSYTGGTTVTGGVLNASSSTALGTGAVTVTNVAGNQLQLGNGVNVANALTLAGGGVTAQGLLYVPTGSATYSGTIAVTGAPAAGGVFATGGGTLTIAGNNTITTANPVSVRSGFVTYSGSQNYTTGTNLANAGASIQFAKTTSMPATGAVVLSTGTTLAANVGGAGEFTLGAGSNTAGTIGGLLAGIGGQGAAVTLPAGAQIGIDTTNAAGTQTWNAAFTTTNAVGLVKLGAGTLELNNGGTYTGGGAQGFPLIAREGTLLLSGGTHTANGEVVIGGNFGRSAGSAGTDAKIQLDAGSLVTNNWLSIGRGNGTGGVSSDLVLNNAATVTAANYSAGYNAGSALNLPKGSITLNNTAALTVSGNGQINHAESPGSNMTMTLNGASSFNATGTGIKYIGQGGTGTLNINGTSSVNFGNALAYVGYEAGTGVLNMSGGTFNATGELRVGGSVTNGTTQNGTGTMTMTGGSATVGALTVARGNNNQNTVSGHVTVGTGATFTTTNDVTLGFAGNANLGRLTVSGGTFNVGPAATKWLILSRYDTANSQIDISSGNLKLLNGSSIKAYGSGNGASAGQVVINHTGGDVTYYSDSGTTIGGTGDLDLAYSGAAAGSSTYHLDGGTLTVPAIVSTSTAPSRTFNFNGGTLKAAANGTLLNLGTGSARANVRDGGAKIDTNGHNTIVTTALDHSIIDGDAATDGGLTKLGAGTLTLSGSNSYTGATNVEAGTLDIAGSVFSNVSVKSGAAISGTGQILGSLTHAAGSTFSASTTGAALSADKVTFSGATTLVFTNTPTNGQKYVLFTYGAGGVSGLTNLSSSFRTSIINETTNQQVVGTVATTSLTWNTTDGTWARAGSNWSGAFTTYFNGDTVTFGERSAASTVTLSGVLTPAAVTVSNSTNPYTFTGSGSIAGETSLTKNNAGALTLATANSYTGGTTLNGGTLNLNHASALGTGTLVINGGTLNNTSGSAIVMSGNFPQQWDADVTFTGSSSLDMGMGAVTVGGTGTSRTVTVGANTLAVGEITSAAHNLVKQGAGTLEVGSVGVGGGASSVTGTLEVAAGTLQINRTGTNAAASGDFTAAGLTGSGTLTNGAAVERWFFTNPADGSHTFAGTLANGGTGTLGFNKNGLGTQVLSGNNSYTGTTTVAGGELVISGNNSGAGTYTNVTGGKLTLANSQSLGTAGFIQLSGVDVSTLDLATDTDGTAYAISMNSGTSAAIVSNRATAGAGINHTLTTQNLANGLGTGTLNITSGANVTSGSGRITFTQFGLGAGAAGTTTLNPTTANVTLGSVSKQNNDVSQTLGLGGTSPDNHVTGVIANGAALATATNNISVVKTGTSTWTLSGNSTYTGTTTVSGGTLAITGDNSAATGAVTVEAGATLAGNGNLGGAVTINAGATQTLAVATTPANQATRTIGGALTHSFGSAITLTAGSQPANGVYTLVNATGGVTFDSATVVNLVGITGGVVSATPNSLILTVGSGGGSGFSTWGSSLGLTGANNAAGDNPDADGYDNGTEYILGGHPLSGSNNPKVYSLIADSSADEDSTRELILTIAVPQGTPAFPAGSPTSAVNFEGFGIAVRGSTDLANFTSLVTPVDPVTTGLPSAPVQGGVTYEYRSFSLGGSNGTTGKGFLQVTVTNP